MLEIEQPITCPSCGGRMKLRIPGRFYVCLQEHTYSTEELDAALILLLRYNLQTAVRQIKEREFLLSGMAALGMADTPTTDNALLIANKILASLPAPKARLT